MQSELLSQTEWLQALSRAQPAAAAMLAKPEQEQRRLGYFHTLREICQQPATWLRTSELMISLCGELTRVTEGLSSLCLTGSGSSEYAGDCARAALRKELGIDVQAVPAGALLMHGAQALPIAKPTLMVSLARSGDSPESMGALTLMRKLQPEMRHLVLTCNGEGRLAVCFKADSSVTVIVLDDDTNDRSLVMTSSFTNMVLAARFLGLLNDSARYQSTCEELAQAASTLLRAQMDVLAEVARRSFRRVLFLGSGAHFAAAREASLKMLEMTAGRVATTCETYLGLRHGPMSAVHQDTLIVCFLSTDSMVRAYEVDVLTELARKQLGLARMVAGEGVPADLLGPHDVAIQYQLDDSLPDDDLPVMDVVVAQLLALFRCLHEGLRPDSPSEAGIIHRVVQGFALHSWNL